MMKMKAIAVAVAAAMVSLSAAAQDPKKPMDDKDRATPAQSAAPDSRPQGSAATGDTAKAKKPGKAGAPMGAEADKEKKQ